MQVWWLSFFGASALLVTLAVAIPTTKSDTTDTEVPREFPKLNQNYTFVDNSSIRENLAKNSKVDTEVQDLLKDDDISQTKNETIPEVPPEIQDEEEKKAVVEWIENGDDTEDDKFPTTTEDSTESGTTTKKVTTEVVTQPTEETKAETSPKIETTTTEITKIEAVTIEALKVEASENKAGLYHGVGLIDGSVAAILVGFFLVFCILGYTALILWRRALEKKYGSREILVDEDIFDPDDMRHFSI